MSGAFQRKSACARAKEKAAKVPPRIVELHPDAWADTCSTKPSAPVKIGLRLLSERELTHARAAAAQEAWRLHPRDEDEPNRVDCFNQKLVGLLMAEATTKPDDIAQPFFPSADTKIFLDLTTDGIRRLFDEYEILALLTSPIAPEATDDDLDLLADGLMSGELVASLDIEQARKVRRLLKAVLEESGI